MRTSSTTQAAGRAGAHIDNRELVEHPSDHTPPTATFACNPIYQQHADEDSRAAADAMDALLTGKPAPSLPTPWLLHWDTWAAS